MTIIEVTGIKTLQLRDRQWISPGRRPNQFISQGAKDNTPPLTIRIKPNIINQRPIFISIDSAVSRYNPSPVFCFLIPAAPAR